MDLEGLARKVDRLSKEIEKESAKIANEVAIGIIGNLVSVTPVDTSAAISNWTLRLDSPDTSEYDPIYEGSRGSTADASAGAVMDDARSTLEGRKVGRAIYITNNLPYISDLNAGSSKQEPAGFVERAILVGRNILRSR